MTLKDVVLRYLLHQRLYLAYCRLGKLPPQSSQYWVPINIGNQVLQSYADLPRLDSQFNSPDTNNAGVTLT